MTTKDNILMLKQNGDNANYSYAITKNGSIKDFGKIEDLHEMMEIIEEEEITSIHPENSESLEVN